MTQLGVATTFTAQCSTKRQDTCMFRACHTARQPPQSHPLGHSGRWTTPSSAEEMLDGQHQRMDISAHARTAQGPPAEMTGRGSLLNHPSCPPDDLIGQGTELNWTDCVFCPPLSSLVGDGQHLTLVSAPVELCMCRVHMCTYLWRRCQLLMSTHLFCYPHLIAEKSSLCKVRRKMIGITLWK